MRLTALCVVLQHNYITADRQPKKGRVREKQNDGMGDEGKGAYEIFIKILNANIRTNNTKWLFTY